MAKTLLPATWHRGFRQVIPEATTNGHQDIKHKATGLPSVELLTSAKHNDLGLNRMRTWPTLYDGTNSPHRLPDWWQPQDQVDVLICGAGPSGLEIAVSLARQGVSFRIIDKAEGPLLAGRADGVQPRFLEILHAWGLAEEVAEEGPIIERTAIYKDGKKLHFGRSHQSDSRYRGLHVITQGQIERIYIRDLLRHKALVERSSTVTSFTVDDPTLGGDYPVQAVVRNEHTQAEQIIRAKFLVGSDGAASTIRKQLDIPFEGVSTGIYWGIMDCIFESDYPHAWIFGSVISSKHGGCVIIPREDGYIRLYTQLDIDYIKELSTNGQVSVDSDKQDSGGAIDIDSITPDQILEQANRIFAPYTLKFAAPLSWYAVWKISERVARSFSSSDQRVHLAGDAAHVHSVMGAFGLNASIMDASNLAWKLGLCAKGAARIDSLAPTYNTERRLHACRVIRTSGEYLRFVCSCDIPLAEFDMSSDGQTEGHDRGAQVNVKQTKDTSPAEDLAFLHSFFARNGQFLLGVDAPYPLSVLNPKSSVGKSCVGPMNGVRAPNPRICLGTARTGYLYDLLIGVDRFHILLFGGNLLQQPSPQLRTSVTALSQALSSPKHFFHRYGGSSRFQLVLVVKALPFQQRGIHFDESLAFLSETATLVFDDRAPDDDAHTIYGVDTTYGAAVVVRPDLWIGTSSALESVVPAFDEYFGGFLL